MIEFNTYIPEELSSRKKVSLSELKRLMDILFEELDDDIELYVEVRRDEKTFAPCLNIIGFDVELS